MTHNAYPYHTLLPVDAQAQLRAAARVGEPRSAYRARIVGKVVDYLKTQYPTFFKEQQNG